VNLAVLYSRGEEWPQGRAAFEEAWSITPRTGSQRPLHEARIASNYGTQLFEHRAIDDAETWLRRAVAASRAFSEPEPRAYLLSLGTLGRLLTEKGAYDEAHEHLSLAVAELDRFRSSFRAERTNLELIKTLGWVYEAMIDCCALSHSSHPERAREAFELVERTKWRVLTTLLRYLPLGLIGPGQEPLVTEEHELLNYAQLALQQPGLAASHSETDLRQSA
jgi:tetratricopeptide (TPR) repeat protein